MIIACWACKSRACIGDLVVFVLPRQLLHRLQCTDQGLYALDIIKTTVKGINIENALVQPTKLFPVLR